VVHNPELMLNQSNPKDEKLPVIDVGALQLIWIVEQVNVDR
jgi:hypothetical protein